MYRAAVWLRQVKEVYGDSLQVEWKPFCLEQVNSKEGPDWKLWEQPDGYPSRGLPALRAAEAARRQGPEAHERLHYALLEGRHENRKDFTDPEDIEEMASAAGLDMDRFRKDVTDRALLQEIGVSHTHAVSEFGCFGTPTFKFSSGKPFFMRIKPPETALEAARIFDGLRALFVDGRQIDEVKRPHKPRD